ncbi:UDP-N-acetylmuramoyl-tripeptide--D-alanyl-D-alanine ligase [Bacillaceae bacterium Marseille-Q3522]|nr:UDP-N-acetylmuramoyl-tripeptide--D-alanyl-D-alanine ligase [Bacillaceae bacterium Marseille-Q3522]
MIKKTIKQISELISVKNDVSSFYDRSIHGVSIDSRNIAEGNLFIPFKGERSDGHRFVEEALEKGAAAALWQKDVPNPPSALPVLIVDDPLKALQDLARSYRDELPVKIVGITGSNGKTTTKDMTASLLSLVYKVQKTQGNYNNHIGLPLTLLSLDKETEIAVVEMGMSAKGEIAFLTKLARPDVAIITNIGESHLQDLGSRENIANAKLEILEGLNANGRFIYDGDEPLLQQSITGKESFICQSFGRSRRNDLYAAEIQQTAEGSLFRVNIRPEIAYHLPVLGTHNVLNALAAIAAAAHFQIPYEKMDEGFSNLQMTHMRMELVEGASGEKIINDAYNASPTSMKAAIDLVSDLPDFKEKILVLGDMRELGVNETQYHYEIGKSINAKKIEYVFTYGKLGSFIAKGAKEVMPEDRVFTFMDKEALVNKLKSFIQEDLIILVKGSRAIRLEEIVAALQK